MTFFGFQCFHWVYNLENVLSLFPDEGARRTMGKPSHKATGEGSPLRSPNRCIMKNVIPKKRIQNHDLSPDTKWALDVGWRGVQGRGVGNGGRVKGTGASPVQWCTTSVRVHVHGRWVDLQQTFMISLHSLSCLGYWRVFSCWACGSVWLHSHPQRRTFSWATCCHMKDKTASPSD